jgi:two-component system NtrC family response regulator/two-component system response regulator HydG
MMHAQLSAVRLSESPATKKKRILVVDDHVLTRETVALMLRDEGYHVALAADGEEAIILLPAYHPDLVLTDLTMPRRTGIDVLTCARLLIPATPVIIFTSDITPEVEQEAWRLGVRDYIHKPFDINDLLERINRILGPSEVR